MKPSWGWLHLSLLTDSHRLDDQEATPWPPWTPLQLWDTMEIITSTKHNHVPYHTLRNMIFDGDDVPLRALIEHDIVGCRVGRLPDRVLVPKSSTLLCRHL